MYTIRVDSAQQMLRIEMSGRVTTGEALRALSQAMALADASRISAASCDISEVERGPGGMLMLAAVFSSRYRSPMRVAFIGEPGQARTAQRFINFTGHSYSMGFFTPSENAGEWLSETPQQAGNVLFSETAERHVRILFGVDRVTPPVSAAADSVREEGAA
jgi:hypothetical protein